MTELPPDEPFLLETSPGFADWLADTGGSIAFTTYQAGKLFLLGINPQGSLSVTERSFPRCMGLAVGADGRSLALATHYQIQRFDNVLTPGQVLESGGDALYAPHAAWVTGGVDTHDVGFDADLRPLFVATAFNCIARVSDGHSFRPVWRPDFVSQLVGEDRCHLNGMAMAGGKPVYATAASRSDTAESWRDRRGDGGIVIHIDGGDVVADGLSMPHSPRLHNGALWALSSGHGALGRIDPIRGEFEVVGFCSGFARGLAFAGGHAIVGLSLPREETFSGLALDDALTARGLQARCGLAVIDLVSGETVHSVHITGVVRELYDVAVLPGVGMPSLIGFKTDDVKQIISVED